MKILSAIASILPLVGFVAADALHLVDCDFGGGVYSEILYYANDGDSYNGQFPPDANICQWTYKVTWTNPQWCQFRSKVTAHTDVRAAANVGDWAGTAYNDYHSFNCYKDNNRVIYKISSGSCNSKYYCLS